MLISHANVYKFRLAAEKMAGYIRWTSILRNACSISLAHSRYELCVALCAYDMMKNSRILNQTANKMVDEMTECDIPMEAKDKERESTISE